MGIREDVDQEREEATDRTWRDVNNLWIVPEVDRRRADGRIDDNFQIYRAQVILHPDRPVEVRLNDEVRGVVRAAVTGPVAAGQLMTVAELGEVSEVLLTSEDPDAAHVTMLLTSTGWALHVDFRYNATRARALVELADDYLRTARNAWRQGRPAVAMENLYAAVELTARSYLLAFNKRAKGHGSTNAEFNRFHVMGGVPKAHVELWNTVRQRRPKARYSTEFTLDPKEMSALLRTAREMVDGVREWLPKRAVVTPEDRAEFERARERNA